MAPTIQDVSNIRIMTIPNAANHPDSTETAVISGLTVHVYYWRPGSSPLKTGLSHSNRSPAQPSPALGQRPQRHLTRVSLFGIHLRVGQTKAIHCRTSAAGSVERERDLTQSPSFAQRPLKR